LSDEFKFLIVLRVSELSSQNSKKKQLSSSVMGGSDLIYDKYLEKKQFNNNYNYEEAVKYDRRSLCEIFFIYCLSKQVLFHTFCFNSPFSSNKLTKSTS